MNKDERLKELKQLFSTPGNQLISVQFKTFSDLHKRIDELVGRPTMTHEFAFPDLLYDEIASGKRGNPLGEALTRATALTKQKKAIIITPETDEDIPGTPLGFKIVGKVDLSKTRDEENVR